MGGVAALEIAVKISPLMPPVLGGQVGAGIGRQQLHAPQRAVPHPAALSCPGRHVGGVAASVHRSGLLQLGHEAAKVACRVTHHGSKEHLRQVEGY